MDGLEGFTPSSLFNFREKGDAWITPFGRVADGVTLPSCVGVAGCAEPLERALVPLVEERPLNLGSLDTMADLMDAFSSIRCQPRHGAAWNFAQLNDAVFIASWLVEGTVYLFVVF